MILWMATDSDNSTYLYLNEPTKGEKFYNLKTNNNPYLKIGKNVYGQKFEDGVMRVEIILDETAH